MVDLARMRSEYEQRGLDVADVVPDPIDQFLAWLDDAVAAELTEPNAMVVATVDPDGRPATRHVLCKGVSPAADGHRGLEFYTNRRSTKADHLGTNDQVSATFGWLGLHRQVTLLGTAFPLTDAENDDYFAVRPRGSQLGAWASPQSEPIDGRHVLDDALAAADARFPGPVDRPPHWGGYRLVPRAVEFWQGQPNRLHDRVRYRLDGTTWITERLAP